MKIIAITQPFFFDDEALAINNLLAKGCTDMVHLRKPGSDADGCRRLLDHIACEWLGRIVTHDHFELCAEYGLHGVHLNHRNPAPPQGLTGSVSCSCHSLDEVTERKPQMDYMFLSPIFDSISKQGYHSAFDDATLRQASAKGIIDNKVVALGGVTYDRLALLEEYGFGGAAMLGAMWR